VGWTKAGGSNLSQTMWGRIVYLLLPLSSKGGSKCVGGETNIIPKHSRGRKAVILVREEGPATKTYFSGGRKLLTTKCLGETL